MSLLSSNTDASELRRIDSTFYLLPVGASECEKIIASLKSTKTDLNTVPVRLLKRVSEVVSYPLSRIITLSFVTGVSPDNFKIARVSLIFEKGDSFDPSNYRQIFSLSYISKVFEKCAKVKACSFFNKYRIFSRS